MATSTEILERLTRLHAKVIDRSLERMPGLLADLGDPHRRLPPVVHVAGTNGKGSLVAYLKAITEAAGYRVHVYTSPHLVRFNERIVLAGQMIADDALTELLERVERVNAGRPITVFEITTIAAFLAFAEHPADLTLLEVGMGGRLDATNLVEQPALTAIQPVQLDHQAYLGDTIAEIAAEKAGILKPGVTGVIGPQEPDALAAIEARAAEIGAPLLIYGRDFVVGGDHRTGLHVGGPLTAGFGHALGLPPPGLYGHHQIANAGVAAAAALALRGRFELPDRALAEGLRTVQWPARLQRLKRGPLVDLLPPGWELWLDGGHNPGAGAALAPTLADWRDRPLHLVMGMLANKDADGYLQALRGLVADLRAITIPGDTPSHPAEALVAAAQRVAIPAAAADSVADGIRAIVAGQAQPGTARILICGALYLAGLVLAENG